MSTDKCKRQTEQHSSGLYLALLAICTERFGYFAMLVVLVIATNDHLHIPLKQASAVVGYYLTSICLGSLAAGLLSDLWLGPRRSLLIGFGMLAVGAGTMALPGRPAFYVGLGAMGVGSALVKPIWPALIAGQYAGDKRRLGGGFLALFFAINLGGFLAPLTAGHLWLNYHVAVVFGVIAALHLAVLVVLFLGRRRLVPVAGPQPQTRAQVVRGAPWILLVALAVGVCQMLMQGLERKIASHGFFVFNTFVLDLSRPGIFMALGTPAIALVGIAYWLLRRVGPMQSILARLLTGVVVLAVMMGCVQLLAARPDGWPRLFALSCAIVAGGSVGFLLPPTLYELVARTVPRFAATFTALSMLITAFALWLGGRLGFSLISR